MKLRKLFALLLPVWTIVFPASAQKLLPIGIGWSNNSVNTTVFRKNSLVSHQGIQFAAYYDPEGVLILAKRKLKEDKWITHRTQYKGNVTDAHNSISIMVDGDGYLHIAWDHHGHPLRYAKGIAPLSLELGEKEEMTGISEEHVTYPEFFRFPGGDLLFMYRDGFSGRGNLVINHYCLKNRRWTQKQKNLIDGEKRRNAYWQACVDRKGAIHISWVWRESWDVSTNHDLCYARSTDHGESWERSDGSPYTLPIRAGNSEYICMIPQESELINQTSMTTDEKGNPYIATYWREKDSAVPQYHIVYNDGERWNDLNLRFRETAFSLRGGGTKSIPVSRPQIVVRKKKPFLLFRDEERGAKVSLASCENLKENRWKIHDLTPFGVGSWEPSYDTELWREKGRLHLFVQKTTQIDGEGKADVEPEPVQVLEIELK